MSTLFYSMAGEGRGHAVRVRVLVECLRARHKLVLFAPGDAYNFLEPYYRGTDVSVCRIPGLHFKYSRSGHLDLPQTFGGGVSFLRVLPGLIRTMQSALRDEKPALCITDFEPALPRAARACGVPFVSLNHQHFLVVSDLTHLPVWLQRHAVLMSFIVRGFYSGQRETVVSSFFNPPPRKNWERAIQIGVLLRKDVLEARPECHGHVMVYFRKFASPRILEALRRSGRPVRVFGLGERPADGPLQFVESREQEFLHTLRTCDALVTTAGNQLVGEALYLGKPVFALPESGNYEQYINAHCLAQSGGGTWDEMDRVEPHAVRNFLNRLDHYRNRIPRESLDGTPRALSVIERYLN